MSDANLHIVLTYDPFFSVLIASFYTKNNIPNSDLPVPYDINGTYIFIQDDNTSTEIIGNDPVLLAIPRPTCSTRYNVTVVYTANGVIQPLSTAIIVIGQNYIINNAFISQSINIDNTITLTIVSPTGVTPVNIQWAYNYNLITPLNPLSILASENGIYEIAFQNTLNGFTYYSTTEVINANPAMYLKIFGDDGNLYGTFGAPSNIPTLYFSPIGTTIPVRYKIYVNGILYSNNSFLNLATITTGSLIYIYAIDCYGITLSANTFILPCGVLPVTTLLTADTDDEIITSIKSKNIFKSQNISTLDAIPRPIKGRPSRLPNPPKLIK